MKWDEFAFVNRQLAGMLQSGVPLEGALKQLCADMQRGLLREELEFLEQDLAKGRPLDEALASRRLPTLYCHMVRMGVKSGDLPGTLARLGDYYGSVDSLWKRFTGLMVYPMIVLVMAAALSVVMAAVFSNFNAAFFLNDEMLAGTRMLPFSFYAAFVWMPVVVLFGLLAGCLYVFASRSARDYLMWRVPGIRDLCRARVAATLHLLLKGGVPLRDALPLVIEMEKGTRAEGELARWNQAQAEGSGHLKDSVRPGIAFPPLFVWLVTHSNEDAVEGFRRAQIFYGDRAAAFRDRLLQAVLPAAVTLLGFLLLCQAMPTVSALRQFMIMLDNLGS